MTQPNPLAYSPTPIPEGCHFKFSPSQFSNFIQSPHNWYRTEVLGEESFSHNTSTVIGTIVHYCAEMVAKGEDVDQDMIEDYIESLDEHEDYSWEIVHHHWKAMAEELVNSYVLEHKMLGAEEQVGYEIMYGYAAAGQIDRLEGHKEDCMIVDYKTYNSKTKPRAFPQYYKYQLLVYAWILKKLGYNPTRIRLVYVNRSIDGGISDKTGKPLKSYPPEVTVLTEVITEEDLDFINGLLELAVDSVEAAKNHPELRHVIFHDPRLKIS
jgi:hypothetical protein